MVSFLDYDIKKIKDRINQRGQSSPDVLDENYSVLSDYSNQKGVIQWQPGSEVYGIVGAIALTSLSNSLVGGQSYGPFFIPPEYKEKYKDQYGRADEQDIYLAYIGQMNEKLVEAGIGVNHQNRLTLHAFPESINHKQVFAAGNNEPGPDKRPIPKGLRDSKEFKHFISSPSVKNMFDTHGNNLGNLKKYIHFKIKESFTFLN